MILLLILYPLVNTRAASERARENRYALPARARAFFRGVFYTPSVNVTRTLHVRNNARNKFATTSSLRSCGPELSGERFFAPTTIPICHLPEILLALAASSFVLFVCGTAVTVQVGRVLWPGTLGRCLVRRALRARLLGRPEAGLKRRA